MTKGPDTWFAIIGISIYFAFGFVGFRKAKRFKLLFWGLLLMSLISIAASFTDMVKFGSPNFVVLMVCVSSFTTVVNYTWKRKQKITVESVYPPLLPSNTRDETE